MNEIKTLAIETSCDETAVSIIETRGFGSHSLPTQLRVLSHVVESQLDLHRPFGGVVPEVAARDHLAKIAEITERSLEQAGLTVKEVDEIAVTMGPGLIGALMVGVLFARGLSIGCNLPLRAVNHVDAHLAPALLLRSFKPQTDIGSWFDVPETPFPALSLTVSGGHCHLSRLNSPHEKQILGKSIDDACGEAFDKVAKLLGLPYPGGPHIEALSLRVTSSPFKYPSSLQDKTNRTHFSFSGLKTAVLDTVRKLQGNPLGKISGASLDEEVKCQIAYAFQEAALGQLRDRVSNALFDSKGEIRSILVAGGVAANQRFRELFESFPVPVHFAPLSLCSDNATMIAMQARIAAQDGLITQPFPRYQSS